MLKGQWLFVPHGNLYGFSHRVGWIFLLLKLMVLKYRIPDWDTGLTASGQRCKKEPMNKNHAPCKPYTSHRNYFMWVNISNMNSNESRQPTQHQEPQNPSPLTTFGLEEGRVAKSLLLWVQQHLWVQMIFQIKLCRCQHNYEFPKHKPGLRSGKSSPPFLGVELWHQHVQTDSWVEILVLSWWN